MTTLRGRSVLLRPLEPGDVLRLAEIQREPSVLRWWGEPDLDELERKAHGTDEATAFAIEVDGRLVGLIQYYEEDDPDYRHAGIDIFLGADAQGRGLGTEAVRVLARHLVDDLGHRRLVIDPAAANAPAIRAYEKVGFKTVGVMREHWRGPDGEWHDGVLMDLLARELR